MGGYYESYHAGIAPNGYGEVNMNKRPMILNILIALAAIAVIAAAGVVIAKVYQKPPVNNSQAAEKEKKPVYQCPMHHEVISDKPSKCPICGMDLVLVETAGGKDEKSAVPGHADIAITQEGRRLAGVQVAEAKIEKIGRSIRTVGTVVPDETRVRHVHTKIAGTIEKLFVNFTGQLVREGEPVLTIYSPELLSSQEEYIQSLNAAKEFAVSSVADVRKSGEQLVAAARKRLELFDVPADLISEIEKTGKAKRTVTLMSPAKGFVMTKNIFEGHKVDPDTELFIVTDLSKIWIEAVIYESEAQLVKVGRKAAFTMPYDTSKEFTGTVSYIYPYLNSDSRTLKVRFDFDNPKNMLKPGMFVNLFMASETVQGVAVPDTAVVDTGVRQIVYVETGDNSFSARAVTVLMRSEGLAIIKEGIKEGEKVAVKGNFLLDSESRIQSTRKKETEQ